MTTVQEIEKKVSSLPHDELAEFRAWFEKYDAIIWDKQFEKDAKSGKLDAVSEKAIEDYKRGNYERKQNLD